MLPAAFLAVPARYKKSKWPSLALGPIRKYPSPLEYGFTSVLRQTSKGNQYPKPMGFTAYVMLLFLPI